MNQTQIKYARERANAIYTRKQNDLRKLYTTEAKLLSTDEKLKALKAGAFTIVPQKDRNDSGFRRSWDNFVLFTDEIKGGLNTDAFEKAKAKLDADFTRINDELVLGDNEQALKLLEAFDGQ